MKPSFEPSYFETLYSRDPDPWRFATSAYEREKYEATLAVLPARLGRVFEIGCSIGVLTRRLAARCETLLAVDVAEAALRDARRRCCGWPNVTIRRMRIPYEWPDGRFDAIVLSEILYFLSSEDVRRTAAAARASTTPGAPLLLVHYTDPTNYPLSGDAAADTFIAASGARLILQRRAERYRLDLLLRR